MVDLFLNIKNSCQKSKSWDGKFWGIFVIFVRKKPTAGKSLFPCVPETVASPVFFVTFTHQRPYI